MGGAKNGEQMKTATYTRTLSLQYFLFVSAVAVVVVGIALVFLYMSWSHQVETQMAAECRVLATSVSAAWDFMEYEQDNINTDRDGTHNFKGLHCSLVGKSVGELFSRKTDYRYKLRYIRENPRSVRDVPDELEQEALTAFADGEQEYYRFDTDESGQRVFRYIEAIYLKESCLDCHGQPQGELDETGFEKEGMSVGDLSGAVSITMPIDEYVATRDASLRYSIGVILVLVTILLGASSLFFHLRVSTPLRRANETLAQENEYVNNVTSMLSHELRTPLTSIIAYTSLWEKQHPLDDNRTYIETIRRSSSALLEMSNNILDITKIEAGCMKPAHEVVDCADLLNTVVETVKPTLADARVSLHTRVDAHAPLVYGDWALLQKIMLNLVSNAVKFTLPGGTVDVWVAWDESRGVLEIHVRDTGIGIAKEDQGRIFEKFTQVDTSGTRKRCGTGLGLSFVKNAVEVMGGEVRVSSDLGKGSHFVVEFKPDVVDEGDLDEDSDS